MQEPSTQDIRCADHEVIRRGTNQPIAVATKYDAPIDQC